MPGGIHHTVVIVRQLRAVFLGDPGVPDDQAGVLELNVLDGAVPGPHITQPTPGGPLTIATVRDPDGVLVLLTPGSITRRG
jgi:catechol 2,3-dioxygenase-like lactoylglutathione lyase family enzyme